MRQMTEEAAMTLTPAAARIIEAAIDHFAVRGYDGASLSDIADAVGIRKASLYAHFDSKGRLFMAAFEIAVTRERARAHECFAAEGEAWLPGARYAEDLLARYPNAPHLRFFLRCSYMSASGLPRRSMHCMRRISRSCTRHF